MLSSFLSNPSKVLRLRRAGRQRRMPATAPAAARKPLKRSHTSPTSQIAAGQRIALPQQAQTPKASAPPANWGQALKAGLATPAPQRQASGASLLSPSDESTSLPTPSRQGSFPKPLGRQGSTAAVKEMKTAAQAVGVAPASLLSSASGGSASISAAGVGGSLSAQSKSGGGGGFKPRPLVPQKQDTIDLLAQTLEGKLEDTPSDQKQCSVAFRDPTIEHDYRAGAFLECVETLRWWAVFCACLAPINVAYDQYALVTNAPNEEQQGLLLQCVAIRFGAALFWVAAAVSLPRVSSHVRAAARKRAKLLAASSASDQPNDGGHAEPPPLMSRRSLSGSVAGSVASLAAEPGPTEIDDPAARDACASPRRQLLCACLFGLGGLSLVAQAFLGKMLGFGRGWSPKPVSYGEGESHLLLALILGSYSIVTPSLPMAPTAVFSCLALPLYLVLFLGLWWQPGDHLTNALLGAELAKACAAQAIGLFVAYHDDRQSRDNYWSSRLTNEVIYLQTRVRERAHNLLLNTLPAPIVQHIAQGTVRTVSRFETACVLQCDLVGFTKLSAEYSPQEVVNFVSELFEAFDELADEFGADKIKTIGDAYVVCAGALSPCANPEATMVELGLGMVAAVTAKCEKLGIAVGARIGVHSGLVMGGIIGTVKFHFDMRALAPTLT